ncbi:lipoprotein [Streptomyces laurentii]|uniref:Lipoprotein n=1 Tax=Streptomyces laurentii TaxID=39478 RepID=A0A160P665_STRLU|nr:lipoprotein [Streptomyces laurentii]
MSNGNVDMGKKRARTVRAGAAATLLTASLVLTGCAGGGTADAGSADAKAADRGYAAGSGAAADRADGPSAGLTAKPPAQGKGGTPRTPAAQQHVIRTAELSVRVRSVENAAADARRAATDAGGRVETETTQRDDGDEVSYSDESLVTSRLVLRVPQDRYDDVLTKLAGGGKLLSRKADAKDVTDQVVDVESRIATQRASVARVRELMDKATQLSDVVSLESELSRRQADLEALLAQQASLKDRTSLATITLLLSETRTSAPPAEDDDRPGFLDALSGGWHALATAVTWVLVVLAALAPWLAVAAVGYAVWRWLIRPRLRRRAPVATGHGALATPGLPHWTGGTPGTPASPAPAAPQAPAATSGTAGTAGTAGSGDTAGPSMPAPDGEPAE